MTSYLPFAGYWFYYPGGTSANLAALFCSWGLLFVAPVSGVIGKAVALYNFRKRWQT